MSDAITGGDAKFAGGAFHPDLENGRASGFLKVSPGGVFFDTDQATIELPLEKLKITLGGSNDRILFFNHPLMPEATLYTSDHSILKHAAFAQRPELAAQIGTVRTKKRVGALIVLSLFLAIAGGITGLWLAKGRIVKAVASSVPAEWEISLGNKLFEQIKLSKHFIEDTNLDARLSLITTPLVSSMKDLRYPLKFHIVEDSTLNAFAIPGGNVVIHTGLLLAAEQPEEIAGVLAHEINHVTRRHSIRAVISSVGLYAVLQAFVGDATSLLAVIANNSAFLIDRKFSRDFEREADDGGWDAMVAADLDPRGMIGMFRKLEAEEQKLLKNSPVGTGALSWISTHPATDERVAALEAKWKRLPKQTGFRKIELNYADFKDKLRASLSSAPNPERN